MKTAYIFTIIQVAISLNSCVKDSGIDSTPKANYQNLSGDEAGTLKASLANNLSPYDKLVLTDQPVAFWNDATVNDATGNGHDGTIMYNPEITRLPNGDCSLLFNGISQYAEVANSPAFSVQSTGIITLEAWIRPDVLDFPDMEGTGYVNWMGKGEPGQHEYVCRIYGQSPTGNDVGRGNRIVGNVFTLTGQSSVGSYYQPTADWQLSSGEWLHYVFVINTKLRTAQFPYGYTQLYVQRRNSNGIMVTFEDKDALKSDTLLPGNAPFRIATRNLASYFKGAIGKIAIYNYELTADKVSEHAGKMYGYDYFVLSGTPVAYWNVGGTDISGNGHQGILFGNPPVETLPNGDESLVFVDTTQYMEVTDAPEFSVPATGILTLEAWIRPDVLSFRKVDNRNYVHWMGKRTNGQCEYACRMYNESTVGADSGRVNRISGYAFNLSGNKGAGSYYQAVPNWRVQVGEWIHYVLIINTLDISTAYPTGYTRLYVHRQNSSGAIVTFHDQDALIGYSIVPGDGTAPFRIGTVDLGSFFQGSIGKAAVYNYEMTASTALEHAEKMYNP